VARAHFQMTQCWIVSRLLRVVVYVAVISMYSIANFFEGELKLLKRGENSISSNHVLSTDYDGTVGILTGKVAASMKNKNADRYLKYCMLQLFPVSQDYYYASMSLFKMTALTVGLLQLFSSLFSVEFVDVLQSAVGPMFTESCNAVGVVDVGQQCRKGNV